MSITIEMPKLSDTQTEGVLVKWHKSPGDTVEVGDVIAEVETDKAVMEMEAFDDGVLGEIFVQEGESAKIGEPLATLLEEGESASDSKKSEPKPKEDASAKDSANDEENAETKPETEQESQESTDKTNEEEAKSVASPSIAKSTNKNGRVKASPYARKLAADKNIDLAQITGSGPNGRIVAEDVEKAAKQSANTHNSTAPAATAPVIKVLSGQEDERVPLSGMRRIIADRLLASKQQIPHFYLEVELNMGTILSLRQRMNADAEKMGRPKVTINDLVLYATTKAIVRVPAVNAAFDGDAIVRYKDVQLAVAVALDEGLVTPVIREAQHKSLSEISAAMRDLAGKARNKRLPPEAYQGGTFTVSNLGSYGIDRFFAIINPPQAAILSVGSVVKKPVVDEGNQITIGQRMTVGLSADHRVVDGAIGAQFLAALRDLIENPFGLVF